MILTIPLPKRRNFLFLLLVWTTIVFYVGIQKLQLSENQIDLKNEVTMKIADKSRIEISKRNFICIIGNAEKAEDAIRTHNMWNQRFPSAWYIWGNDQRVPELAPIVHLFFTSSSEENLTKTLTRKEGIFEMLNRMKGIYDCEYFFAHDDDKLFEKNYEIGLESNSEYFKRGIDEILVDILRRFQPAIASFPWTLGDQKISTIQRLYKKYKNREVAPLTGFEIGMVLYHTSVVDFFIPCSPNRQNGFSGEWSLCDQHLNLFGSMIFKENAIRINAINYKNLIRLDNNPIADRKKAQVSFDGQIILPKSRHPYEYHLNKTFREYMVTGLKNPRMRWGKDLSTYDIDWEVGRGDLPYKKFDVLHRINDFYRVLHPLVADNLYIKKMFTSEDLKKFHDVNIKFRFSIHLFTMNRQKSFERLFASIENSNPIKSRVDIYVHFDMDDSDIKESMEYVKFLKTLKSKVGQLTLIINTNKKGLRYNILDSWTPIAVDEFSIFLEDDVSVSKHFLEYSEQMVRKYYYESEVKLTGLIGISLFNICFNEVTNRNVGVINNGGKVFINQQPQSWGAIYDAYHWADFLEWHLKNKLINPLVPNSLTNRWLQEKSWKKYLFRYMYANAKYMIYPNFPGSLSLSTNNLEWGTNDRVSPQNRQLMGSRFTVPLLDIVEAIVDQKTSARNIDILESIFKRETGEINMTALMPDPEYLLAFDMYGEQKSFGELIKEKDEKTFDKCTLVLTVHDYHDTVKNILSFYHTLDILDSIVVIWNNVNVLPPRINVDEFSIIPIYILKQTKNSLNNRFYPNPEIQTDCVVSVSDKWDMPHDQITFAYNVWRGNFFNHLVGYRQQGRTHELKKSQNEIKWNYSTDNQNGVSILLSAGLVFHRKYLKMYEEALPDSTKELVDRLRNCDDILFNFMVSNHTRSGPVVLAENVEENIEASSLLSEDFSDKDFCIHSFVNVFGSMKLKKTKSVFTPRPPGVVTYGLKDLKTIDI